jgi:hypothetical protein
MQINILCPDKDIVEARQKAKEIPIFSTHHSLTIPVSETGDLPITHWFCTFNVAEEVCE